jgi:hypothetical protein
MNGVILKRNCFVVAGLFLHAPAISGKGLSGPCRAFGPGQKRLGSLKKIPESSEFNNLFGRQNRGDQFCLRGGVDFV